MILSDISIRRPVLATVMSLLIILIGLIAFDRLPVREYPNIDAPVVSVRTVYPGASAEVMESQITKPLEDSLSGIEGIKTTVPFHLQLLSHPQFGEGSYLTSFLEQAFSLNGHAPSRDGRSSEPES